MESDRPTARISRWLMLLTVTVLIPACDRFQSGGTTSAVVASTPIEGSRLRASFNDQGLPTVQIDGVDAVTAKWNFWGPEWQFAFAEFEAQPNAEQPGALTLRGEVADLGLTLTGEALRSDQALRVSLTWHAEQALTDVIGGGVEFSLDLENFPGMQPPELLPDDQGWTWGLTESEALAFTADPGLAEVYFERGDRGRIRCFVLAGELPAGKHHMEFTLTLPDGAAVQRADAERYAQPDATWLSDPMPWDAWPIDLRERLEAPAGQRGRVRAEGEQLVFADGTEARFWGVNLQAYALFSGSDADVQRQADRIAALGFNLVRIHHADSGWVQPNLLGDDGLGGDFNEAMAERLDRWVAALQARGVYLWLDLHVGRKLAADELSEAQGRADVQAGGGSIKGYNYVNPAIEAHMESFAQWLLGRTNSITGVRYADEPAIIAVLLTNENDLTRHFGNRMLADKNVPFHHRLFKDQTHAIADRMGLPRAASMRTWEPGPAQLTMAELEQRFFARHIAHIRRTGYSGLIATTNFWGGMSLSGLASLTAGDVIDVHSYGESGELTINPSSGATWLSRVAQAQVVGLPLTITEWNVPHPARDRFTTPLHMAAMASFQGWDAPMLYGYLQEPLRSPSRAREWSAWVDPALMALMPAASVLYLDQHLEPAREIVVFTPDRERVYFNDATADTTPALRATFEQHGFRVQLPDTPELDFDTPQSEVQSLGDSVRTTTDPAFRLLADDASSVTSDTGEITRDWQRGVVEIRTPKSQAAIGWIGQETSGTIDLGDVSLTMDSPAGVVALTSLDQQPLAASQDILLTAVGQAVPGLDAGQPKVVWVAEPLHGDLVLRGFSGPMELVALDGTGAALTRSRVEPDAEGQIRIPLRGAALWYRLQPANISP